MIYLISPDKKQYKANLHCHSILSDGKKTPEELKKMYRAAGYSILAITDHERPVCHQALAEDDFIMLTGYEAYIRPSGSYDPYAPEVHLNLLSRDPESVKIKKLTGPVAGDADCLLFPNIESGNVFFKACSKFAGAELAAMVAGPTAPCVLTSRGDSTKTKLYSIALACLSAK